MNISDFTTKNHNILFCVRLMMGYKLLNPETNFLSMMCSFKSTLRWSSMDLVLDRSWNKSISLNFLQDYVVSSIFVRVRTHGKSRDDHEPFSKFNFGTNFFAHHQSDISIWSVYVYDGDSLVRSHMWLLEAFFPKINWPGIVSGFGWENTWLAVFCWWSMSFTSHVLRFVNFRSKQPQ